MRAIDGVVDLDVAFGVAGSATTRLAAAGFDFAASSSCLARFRLTSLSRSIGTFLVEPSARRKTTDRPSTPTNSASILKCPVLSVHVSAET
nr:hypothetical protein [Stieleria neptunia]